MLHQIFNNVSGKEKTGAVEKLFKHSTPSTDFFLMVIFAVSMATLGLLIDSPAVVVGSMLISPVLYPILGVSMGIVMSDVSLVGKSLITLIKVTILGAAVATGLSLLFMSQVGDYTGEIMERVNPTLISAVIGAIAGLAASFAMVKEKFSETLPGIAISVAIIPPLAVVGIGLSRFDLTVFVDSLLLFIVNICAVMFTSAVVFSMMNFYTKRKLAADIVKKEEKILEKEEKEMVVKK